MSETCPLFEDEQQVDVIPAFCRRNCESLMEKATRENPVGGYDIYPTDHSDCSPDCDLEFSHESIHKVGSSATRNYVITDSCIDCDEEYGEQSYQFECPFNDR